MRNETVKTRAKCSKRKGLVRDAKMIVVLFFLNKRGEERKKEKKKEKEKERKKIYRLLPTIHANRTTM